MCAYKRRAKCANPAQTDFADLLLPVAANQADYVQEAEAAQGEHLARPPNSRSAFAALAPVYSLKLVQTDWVTLLEFRGQDRPIIHSPRDTANVLAPYLAGTHQEHFVALLLDTKGRLIGVTTISIGDLGSAIVHPREVFKPAIIANAASILVAHNHPSGDPTPSPEDAQVSRRLVEAGEIIGIEVLDHVVIGLGAGMPTRWVSLKERGLMP